MNSHTLKHQHWTLDIDQQDVAWLYFDMAGSRVNIFNAQTLSELNDIILWLVEKKPKALIIGSGKSDSFIMGADIEAISRVQDEEEAYQLVLKGRSIFDKIAALPCISIAMIEGLCLGGGLELALACDYRVVCDSAKTRLALPEIKLGICPGWGGTVRLVRLIGVLSAMDMILTGRLIRTKQAKKIGLADVVVPKRQLKRAALATALHPPKKQTISWYLCVLNARWLRAKIGGMLRKKVAAKAKPAHYPAPFQVVDNWVKYGVGQSAFEAEAKSISQLMMTPTCRNLLRVYRLREQLKSFTKHDAEPITHVHVIGAGTMGADIAMVCALNGMHVTLQDMDFDIVATAMGRAQAFFKKRCHLPHLVQAAMDRLIPDVAGRGIEKADLIIEAVIEDLRIKQDLFKQLIPKISNRTLLATNTSSIALTDIAKGLPDPGQLVGIHFFNPVPMMPLVEVVTCEQTHEYMAARAFVFVGQLDKLPLPVKSVPGFLVNRILMPYLLKAVDLLQAGHSADDIDNSACDFGMPMGPIELADKVGLDVCLLVARNLTVHYGSKVPQALVELVESKRFGYKTKAGFYQYRAGKPIRKSQTVGKQTRDKINQVLVDCLIDASKQALEDKVVASSDLLDAGMIFGTGFAPFRGGPMHYAASLQTQGS